MKLLKIKDFIKEAGISRSSLYRLYKKYPTLEHETKEKSRHRLIPINHSMYFDLEKMIDNISRQKEKISEIKGLTDCLFKDDGTITYFWKMEWSVFATISYQNNVNSLNCHQKMSKLFNDLNHYYGHITNLRMLFSTENYSERKGHHNHFLLHSSNSEVLSEIKSKIKNRYSFDQVHISDYNKYQTGVFYVTKGGLREENWDFLH